MDIEPIPFMKLTGRDLADMQDATGLPYGKMAQLLARGGDQYPIELAVAYAWVCRRREDSSFDLDDAYQLDQDTLLKLWFAGLGVDEEALGKAAAASTGTSSEPS